MAQSYVDLLEQQLMTLRASIAFPPTPDLAAGFWQRLETSRAQRPFVPRLRFAGLTLAAAASVLALAIVIVSPARDAAADLFDRINIFETSQSTEGLPTDIIGQETTLERAETALGRHILQPTEPTGLKLDRVQLQQFSGTYVAVLFYSGDDVSFALFASNSGVGKGIPIGADVDVEDVSGLGREAFWLTGRRIVQSLNGNGDLITGSERVTDANTLIWDAGGRVYRIEGDLTKDEAIAIAHSVR